MGTANAMRLSVTLLLCVLALAACGSSGGPPIERAAATKLAERADAVAEAQNPCVARDRALALQRQTVIAINAGNVPAVYQETLLSRVTEIVGELQVRCLPRPASSTPPAVEPEPAPQPTGSGGEGDEREHGKAKGHEKKHKDKGKHGR